MKVAANPVAEVLDQQGWLLSGTFLRVWNGLKGRFSVVDTGTEIETTSLGSRLGCTSDYCRHDGCKTLNRVFAQAAFQKRADSFHLIDDI